MPVLYLVRHALAAPPGLLVGRSDLPLLPEGEAQAARLREELAAVPFSAAWTSPLLRARRTAEVILSGNSGLVAEALVVPGLLEIALGEWEGRRKEEVRQAYPELWEARGRDFLRVPPPGGESMEALAERIRPVFAAIRREAARHGHSLLVAHQAVNRVILADLEGLPLERMREIAQPPAAVTVLELDE